MQYQARNLIDIFYPVRNIYALLIRMMYLVYIRLYLCHCVKANQTIEVIGISIEENHFLGK